MKNSLVNSARLMGNVGGMPVVRTFSNGRKVAYLSLATNESYTNKLGEKVELTYWHRLTFWGKQAEIIEKIETKGQSLMVEGRLKYGQYTDNEGVVRYTTDIEVSEFSFIIKTLKPNAPKTFPEMAVAKEDLPI